MKGILYWSFITILVIGISSPVYSIPSEDLGTVTSKRWRDRPDGYPLGQWDFCSLTHVEGLDRYSNHGVGVIPSISPNGTKTFGPATRPTWTIWRGHDVNHYEVTCMNRNDETSSVTDRVTRFQGPLVPGSHIRDLGVYDQCAISLLEGIDNGSSEGLGVYPTYLPPSWRWGPQQRPFWQANIGNDVDGYEIVCTYSTKDEYYQGTPDGSVYNGKVYHNYDYCSISKAFGIDQSANEGFGIEPNTFSIDQEVTFGPNDRPDWTVWVGNDVDAANVYCIRKIVAYPFANAGSNRWVDEGEFVSLDGHGYSPFGYNVTYDWVQREGPPVTLEGTNTTSPSFIAPQVGSNTTLTFRFYVNDQGTGELGYDDVNITVSNTPLPPPHTPSGCFLRGTPITMSDGTIKLIEDMEVGDMVLAFDKKTKTMKPGKVSHVFDHEQEENYLIINNHLRVTQIHRVLSKGEFTEIGNLKVGDTLTSTKGEFIPITSIHEVKEPVDIFNFEVEPFHTYVAGGYIVHNRKEDPFQEVPGF